MRRNALQMALLVDARERSCALPLRCFLARVSTTLNAWCPARVLLMKQVGVERVRMRAMVKIVAAVHAA